MKNYIQVFDYAETIMKKLGKGILLTTKAEDKVNSMVISWGALGIEWHKPVFITYVREHRFTHELLQKNGEFTINIPLTDFDKTIFEICGSKSGRNMDKIRESGLTLVESDAITVPGIKEFALTLECKVVYKTVQTTATMTQGNKERFYPHDDDATYVDAKKDYHTAFYGEIVKAYILE